jgi:hypothetical protein
MMTGMFQWMNSNYSRAIIVGIACGLISVPIMDALAHMTGINHTSCFGGYTLLFAIFFSSILALDLAAGAVSCAIATRPLKGHREAAFVGFVAGIALFTVELVVFGGRAIADIISQILMHGATGNPATLVDLTIVLLLVFAMVPASAARGVLAACGSLGFGMVMERLSTRV